MGKYYRQRNPWEVSTNPRDTKNKIARRPDTKDVSSRDAFSDLIFSCVVLDEGCGISVETTVSGDAGRLCIVTGYSILSSGNGKGETPTRLEEKEQDFVSRHSGSSKKPQVYPTGRFHRLRLWSSLSMYKLNRKVLKVFWEVTTSETHRWLCKRRFINLDQYRSA